MSRESSLELRVGGFVLLALVGLSFFVASISNLSFMEKGRPMQVIFTFANGLKDAAPVRLAGVEAGLVKYMEIFTDEADGRKTKVRVHIWLRQGVALPIDSTVNINQLGLLGEKYVEITPGRSTQFLQENSTLIGSDPVPMEKISQRVTSLTDKLEVTVDRVNDLVGKIQEGKGTVGRLLKDDSIYVNLEELTADLKVNPWKLLYRPKNIDRR